ncbi:YqjF family protein [Telmatobacter bradus]|uniref:YqjF family protein n=1 Tax=Telmatobacter bradus TaxID=474953 RepID=UPI003B436318
MREYQIRTSFRPRPLPSGRWVLRQRWNDLLFAHWPVPEAQMAALLPDGLDVDTHQGMAWLGIVPFWLDRLKVHGLPSLPGVRRFPDLTMRTYVRDRTTGTTGTYCFSIDASQLLAVTAARFFINLPYHWAEMKLEQRSEREFSFFSRRRFVSEPVVFQARYRGLGPSSRTAEHCSGSFEYYMSERNCLFTLNRSGQLVRSNLHSIPWPLEEAQAEIEQNDLAASIGLHLPATPPVLHYSRRLALYIWRSELVHPVLAARPVTVAVSPSG